MKKSFVNFIENHGEIIAWVRSGMPKVSASAKESFSFDLQMFAIVPLNGKNIADLFTNGCQKVCFDSIIVTDRERRRRFWGSPFLILEDEKIYLDGDSFGEGLSKKDIEEKMPSFLRVKIEDATSPFMFDTVPRHSNGEVETFNAYYTMSTPMPEIPSFLTEDDEVTNYIRNWKGIAHVKNVVNFFKENHYELNLKIDDELYFKGEREWKHFVEQNELVSVVLHMDYTTIGLQEISRYFCGTMAEAKGLNTVKDYIMSINSPKTNDLSDEDEIPF